MQRFFKRPMLIVAVIALITVFFALQFPKLQLDNNNYRFVPKTHPARVTNEYIEETFGSQVVVLVGLERRYGTVFDADFIKKIHEYGKKLEAMNTINKVQSLVTTDYVTGEGDSILVQPLVPDDFAGTPEELAEVKNRVLSWDLYEKALVSNDFTATEVIVTLNVSMKDSGNAETMATFRDIKNSAKEIFSDGTSVYVTGLPVFSANVNEATKADISFLIPLVILVVLLVLFFSFRRLIAIVLPMITVLVATIWSLGAMPLFGISMSILSTVLPVILIAVGSAYGIHVISHYLDERELHRELTSEEHRALVFDLVRKIGMPVFLAALTTFAGFVSFCFTSVLPIREFGYFSSFGVIASFLVAMTLTPSLLLIRGPKPLKRKFFSKNDTLELGAPDTLSTAIADSFMSFTKKKRIVLVLASALLVWSGYNITRLVIDNVMVEYFKDDTDIVQSDRFIRRQFGGSKLLSIVVQSEKPGDVLDPDVLVAMDGLASYLQEKVPEVGKVASFTDLVKRINQVYNADESPDGLALSAVTPVPEANAVPSDASFGDFGDFGTFALASGSDSVSVPDAAPDSALTPKMDVGALVTVMNDALHSGTSFHLDANALVAELNKSTNYQGASYYEIPSDPAKYGKKTKEELKQIISNYLMLLSSDISSYADDPLEPKAVRMNVQLNTVGRIDTDRAIKAMNEYITANFPATVKVTIGGTAVVEGALNQLVVYSQISSVFVSLLMVFLIISISYKSIVAGVIGIIPLLISVFMNFGIMGLLGIKLNIGTALVASVSVGIGIDYTIHYLAAYKREYATSGGAGDFRRRTFETSGKAIMINAISVGAGFAVLLLSKFNILAQFGLLIAFTMFSSSIIALTVLPVILDWIKPSFITKEN